MAEQADQGAPAALAVVVKGYPRLSETFIAQEILALEDRGLPIEIWSLRHPTDKARHPMHERIRARVVYLPEYLYQEPLRVLKGLAWALRQPRFGALLRLWLRDLWRDPTPNRGRRLGQALVMARELPDRIRHLHVHYLHTPASVVRYAARLSGRSWSFSAHAKDIWTIPEWEKREKIADAAFGVTCTREGHRHLEELAPAGRSAVALCYHGLDLGRFPPPPERGPRDGSDPADPVRILSVGRAVEKKGFDDLLDALARLPGDLHWRYEQIGGGPLLPDLKAKAQRLGLADRVAWRGSKPQGEVVAALAAADIFVLPSRPAADGDRDGLPNVIMEAASQRLAVLSTDFAGIPEFIESGRQGLLVPPQDPDALARGLLELARNPALRAELGRAAQARLQSAFDMRAGIDLIEQRLRQALGSSSHADRLLRAHESA